MRPPALPAVLGAALLVVTAASPAGGVGAATTCGTAHAPAGTPVADRNVSVDVLTAPAGTFDGIENASDLHAAVARGEVTPAEARLDDEVARRDLLVLRFELSGNATSVLDRLEEQPGTTPAERFAGLAGSPDLDGRAFDVRVGNGMCEFPVGWAESARRGSLNVVADRPNATLYVALDTEEAARPTRQGYSTGLYGYNAVRVSPPGTTDSRKAAEVSVGQRLVEYDQGERVVLEASEDATLRGTTSVAPGTELRFWVRAVGDDVDVDRTVTARVDRDGRFELRVNLSTVEPGTVLTVVSPDSDQSNGALARVEAPSTPTEPPTTTPPTSTEAPPTTGAQPATTTAPADTDAQEPTQVPSPGPGPVLAALAALVGALSRGRLDD